MSSLVISLDFELFWGVSDSRSVEGYRSHIEGEWDAIPKMLALFEKYDVKATWATVGMLMCRDFEQWRNIQPAVLPAYNKASCSNYTLAELAKAHPRLFFARPLVQQILETEGQELASHTYSHFYCSEQGATVEQFRADLECMQSITDDVGVSCKSLVFPRNQVRQDFLKVLPEYGIKTYRGNPSNWVYADGHYTPGGIAGRGVRFLDSWLLITGDLVSRVNIHDGVVNVPASFFLRPWSNKLTVFEFARLARMKHAMTRAAQTGATCHMWWHPHNFGVNTQQNIAVLEILLKHYRTLQVTYGMVSKTMGDFAQECKL